MLKSSEAIEKHAGVPRLALSVNEACIAAGICRRTLYEHIKAGLLVARKIGTRTVILTEDLITYLRAFPAIDETVEPSRIGRNRPKLP